MRFDKMIRSWLYGDCPRSSERRASKASHDLANEVTKLQAELRLINRAPDPWGELVKAVRGHPQQETRR